MPFRKDNQALLLFGQETERLHFRKLEEVDFQDWLRFCTDPISLNYIFPNDRRTAEEKCREWFNRVAHRYEHNLGGMNALVEKASGKLVGQCGLLVQMVDELEELEIGYSLMPGFRGQGFATEAARKCRDVCFENSISDTLISIIHVENLDSKRVAYSNGMKQEKTTLFHQFPVDVFRINSTEWAKQTGH